MTLAKTVVRNILRKLIEGKDYRIEIVSLIDAQFLDFVIEFFKKIVDAKLKNATVTTDWYKREFLNPSLDAEQIAIHSGLNKKTISNMYNQAPRHIVVNAALEHYDILYQTICDLIEKNDTLNLTLTIKFQNVSVDLTINETLIVINTLAVKRAALRGSLWSAAGKQVEKPLLYTLCLLFSVPPTHFTQPYTRQSLREVDFYLTDKKGQRYRCEVKLMGKGNPESADVVIARNSQIFIADKLSELNKKQLDRLHIHWVELRAKKGFLRFGQVLKTLSIPHRSISFQQAIRQLDKTLDIVFQMDKE